MKKVFAVILLVVMSVALFACKPADPDPTQPPTDDPVRPTSPSVEIPTEDPEKERLARELYESIFESRNANDGSVYCSYKVTVKNLTGKYMLKAACTALLASHEYSNLTTKASSVSGEEIRKYIAALFGNTEVTFTSFNLENVGSFTYNPASDSFAVTYEEQSLPVPCWRSLARWEYSGGELYLYDEYVRVDFDENGMANLYPSSEKTLLITQMSGKDYMYLNNTTAALEYGAKYKHTFRKDSEGNYYWISSEPLSGK